MLYICTRHEESRWSPWGKWVIVHKEKVRIEHLLYEVLAETTLVQLIMLSLPLTLLHVASLMLWIKTQSVKSRNNSCIGVTQENSIEFLVQCSLPFILVPMVRASYCAPYPKWPWVLHKASMCCPCCMTSLCSSFFYFILPSLMISLVTTPSICDWCDSVTDKL